MRVQHGHIEIRDGIGMDRRAIRLPKIGHGLRRLICISEDGFITLSALKWLADVGASFLMLNRNGKVLLATGPSGSNDARLRRAQHRAFGTDTGIEISRTLIDAKLKGQKRVVDLMLHDPIASREIEEFRKRLQTATSTEEIRWLEGQAAISYFGAMRDLPVLWPKIDLTRIPDHWRSVGNRQSQLSGGPRLAITPVHAVLNYCFALLEAETRLALTTVGLDAGLGFGLHTDTAYRDSLALDALEPVRPQVEEWVLSWIMREPLRRADFLETKTGNCRLRSHLCAKLSETGPTWGKLVSVWVEYIARRLWDESSRSGFEHLHTPLTQQHRREAKGRPSFPRIEVPRVERLCRGCGESLRRGVSHCSKCALQVTRENFDFGREAAQQPDALKKRSETQRARKLAIKNWNPSDLPSWLTRDAYVRKVQPALATIAKSRIRSALGVSEPYSAFVQIGKVIPHPRHWLALAGLVGVTD